MNNSWHDKWLEDIDYLKETLISSHNNLFFNITEEAFNEKIENLKLMINDLDYEEMKVELSRVVASIKDAHTSITFPVKKYLPFKLYYFDDGIYIINVLKGYEHLLYKKVTEISGIPIDDVIKDLSEIISYENEYFFKAQCVKYLQVAEILYGLVISDNVYKISLTIENIILEIPTVTAKELIYVENTSAPLHAEKAHVNYWFKYIENEERLYIKYNSCRDIGTITLSEKITDTILFIETNSITNVTIDLRNNLGGDSSLLQPLIDFIKANDAINTKANLKVIIGRETFSSALLNAYDFKLNTNATIIGEPSGGKPNCYGEILSFTLPNSKFSVSYSTKFYKLIEDDSILALYPDEFLENKIDDYKL